MDSLKIIRAGVIGASPHRFLDVVAHPRVNEFKYFYFDNEEISFQSLFTIYEKHKNEINGVLNGRKFSWTSFFLRYAQVVKSIEELIAALPTAMLRTITSDLTQADVLMIGDNDFDHSFALAAICSILKIPYVLTFKETRLRKTDILERLAIEGATRIVVPHEGYIDFIKKKHDIDIKKKAIFADVDYRGKFVYEKYLRNRIGKIKKLSETDGKHHVCILAMRSVWDKNESRSSGRYYYVDIIKELLKAGFVVHLRTKFLIKSVDEPIFSPDNPYFEMAREYPESFKIEPPIDLMNPEGYFELAKYDYGLLTSGAASDRLFLEFERYNIPNRYYEYKMAGVIPIAPKGTLQYMEQTTKDVVFFEKCTDIYNYNHGGNRDSIPSPFYIDLVDAVINALF